MSTVLGTMDHTQREERKGVDVGGREEGEEREKKKGREEGMEWRRERKKMTRKKGGLKSCYGEAVDGLV